MTPARRWLRIGVIAALTFPAASAAVAQTGSAPSIERRLTLPDGPPTFEVTPEERVLTGKDDLVLLRRRKFVTLSADLSPRYSSNAFLSDSRGDGDVAVNGAVGLRAETVIDQRYAVFATAGYAVARYNRFSQLDYDSLSGGIGARMPDGPWTYSLGYGIAVTKDSGFDDHIVTQNVFNGSVSYTIEIDRDTAVFPFVSLTRVFANPGDFDNVSLVPGVSAVHRIAPDLAVSADFQLVGRVYDDFFEETTGRTRREVGLLSGAGWRWTPRPNIVVQGRLGVGYLASTINSVDYFEFNASPTLTARIRF